MPTPPTGTVTFLFTDIEGSTTRWEHHRAAMRAALDRHNALVSGAIDAHGGFVFKTMGDAFCAAFANPADAVLAAIDGQRALAAENWSRFGPDFPFLRVRMALHTGAAEYQYGDYLGPPLNRVARLLATAHGGQVLVSLATQQLVRDQLPEGAALVDLGVHRLKDLKRTEHLFRVVAAGFPDIATPPDTAEQLPAGAHTHIEADALPAECPYRGLLAFRENDTPFFFGRETFTALLVESVAAAPMVGVIGPSGSGKSSVVFAGLVPHLKASNGAGRGNDVSNGGWTAVEMRPGSRPFHALAGALLPLYEGPGLSETDRLAEANKLAGYLRDGSVAPRDVLARIGDKHPDLGRLLLVADQFEELYTLCPDEAEHRAFQDLLFAAAFEENVNTGHGGIPLTLVLTLRADFMGHALAYRPFADAIQKHDVKLGPMTRDELARAVRMPAEKQGRGFESGLVERIVDDVGEKPGSLPLLEFALTKLWEKQEAGWLTHEAYESIGRVEGAVARHADAVYQPLGAAEQERVRRVFVQLVQPGEGTEDTRRLATHEELGADWPLVQKLADARLVVTGRDEAGREVAEVVHEALIRSWQQLREWMSADRRFRTWQERLRFAVRQWKEAGEDEGALLRGVPLAEAEGWLAERGAELAPAERAYVAAGLEQRDREAEEREARIQEELKGARRLRRLSLGIAGIGLVAMGLAVLAMIARQAAGREARFSQARELAAAALSNLDVDPERSTLLVLRAISITQTADGVVLPEVVSALHRAVPALHLRAVLHHDGVPSLIVYGRDGKRVFVAVGQVIKVWDAANGHELATLTGHTKVISNLKASPDGVHLATISEDQTARVWNAETGREEITFRGHSAAINDVEFSPDGSRLATSSDDKTVKVWDVQTGRELTTIDGQPESMGDVDFSPDGSRLAIAGDGKAGRVWDTATGRLLLFLEGHADRVHRVKYSPDGKRLATVSVDNKAKMWDAVTGRELFSFAHSAGNRVEFTNDGSQIATQRTSSAVIFLDVSTGLPLRAFGGDQGAVWTRLAPDGTRFAATGRDSKVRIWDTASGRLVGVRVGHSSPVSGLVFSPDGRSMVTSPNIENIEVGEVDRNHTDVRVWDTEPDREVLSIEGFAADVAFSPDGRLIATTVAPNQAQVWDAATGARLHAFIGHTHSVRDVDFSPDGRYLATAGGLDKNARVWDVTTGISIQLLCCHDDEVQQVTFSPDGRHVATASYDKTAKVWDVNTGRLLHTLAGHTDKVHAVVFSPDGLRLATVSSDATARLWDATTGALLATLAGHTGSVSYAWFSPDSSHLATSSADDSVGIWDVERHTRIRSIGGLMGGVAYIAYSADGLTLVGVGYNGAARVWDAATGQEQFTLGGDGTAIAHALAISPDGRRLAVASRYRTSIYYLRLPDLVALARSRLTRGLTPAECQQYLRGPCPERW